MCAGLREIARPGESDRVGREREGGRAREAADRVARHIRRDARVPRASVPPTRSRRHGRRGGGRRSRRGRRGHGGALPLAVQHEPRLAALALAPLALGALLPSGALRRRPRRGYALISVVFTRKLCSSLLLHL